MKEQDVYADSLEEGMLDKLREKEARSQRPRTREKKQYDEMEISAHGLKIQFAGFLEKLGQSDTREQAMNQLQKLINDYCNADTLRIYLSILKGLKRTVTNSATKEHEVLVIAYLCEKYKTNLIDPIDKPPSLIKTAFRVVELIHSYFNDVSLTVQEACARALIDVYTYCLQNETTESKLSLVFLPLVSILTSGMDRASQSTASVCINELISYWYSKGQIDTIRKIDREVLFVFLKINTEFYIIMNAVATCLKISNLAYLEGKFPQFIAKLLLFLNDNDKNSAKPTPPLNAYMGKVEACKLLTIVATLATGKSEYVSQITPLEVLSQLEKASRNKLIQVQRAARQAIDAWRQLAGLDHSKQQQPIAQEPAATQASPYKLSSLNEMRQKFKREKSKSREHSEETSKTREKIEQELKFMKEDLGELVKGKGWGPQNRGQNFTKKGTGVGGGQIGTLETSPGGKNKKNHDTHIKQLRKFVQQEKEARKTAPDQFPHWNAKVQAANGIQDRPPASNKPQIKAIDSKVDVSEKANPVKIVNALGTVSRPSNFHFEVKSNKYDLDEFQVEEEHGEQQALPSQPHSVTFQPGQGSSRKEIPTRLEDPPTEQLLKALQQFEGPPTKAATPYQPLEVKRQNEPIKNLRGIFNRDEIKELMEDGEHLSAVSSFLGGVMTANDLDDQALSKLDSQVMEQEEDYMCVRELKNERRQSTLRETAEKFLKRSTNLINTKTNNSLQFSQSKKQTHRDYEESLRLELSKVNPKAESPQRKEESPVVSSRAVEQPPTQHQPSHHQEEQQQSVVSQHQKSEAIERPASSRVNSNIPEMFANRKLPNEEYVDEFRGKNFQSMIIKPPKLVQREIRTAGNFRPKDRKQPEAPAAPSELNELEDDGLLERWKTILSLVDRGQVNEAYKEAFELDDSVYLLRCLLLAGPSFDKLTVDAAKQLWHKFSDIYQSNFFQILVLSMFTQAHELDLVARTLGMEDTNFLLQSLYDMSGQLSGRVSYRSAVLYNEIDAKLRR